MSNPTARSTSNAGTLLPKYRDPRTGRTWNGRGRSPRWIQGEDRTLFLIKKDER
ncbi:H-NS family nucleoid-associated regulatory protein [Paraburkholderia sp. RL18-103-BIB-C]|jgi:DNA-binding protein H-NS|uniref:H-NS family nucleoid-associated regulatory protein n=1 Tax=unclassified Paraburkholderia TaxID=2615204 RepID=UPI0038B8B416